MKFSQRKDACPGRFPHPGMEVKMVFSSMIFIWAFLPVVFIMDKVAGLPGGRGRLLRKKVPQNVLLLIASLFFYAWGQPDYLWLLLVSILANYLIGRLMACRKGILSGRTGRLTLLILGIAVNLGILGYYKYFNFFANTLNRVLGSQLIEMRQIALPLGVSFFTFQALTYLVDLYKGKISAEKNVLNLALYFSFFPKITQGPIEKYRDFAPQLSERRQSVQKISEGIRRFIYGLAKKVLIADVLGACVDTIYGLEIGNVNGGFAWIAALFYSFQLYYDFSGYSDMAVGLGKMFGFDLSENFDYPYLASSITEFWRRWHMTLMSWFREYLYFPLGGSRKGKIRTYVNIFIVFMASGLWHGASWDFICWGLYHAVFQVLERLGLGRLLEKTKIIRHVYTCLVVCVGWVFFRAGDMALAFQYLKRMFLPWMYPASGYAVQEIVDHRTILTFFCAVLGCGIVQIIWKLVSGKFPAGKRISGKQGAGRPAPGKTPQGTASGENAPVLLQYSAAELIFCMALLALSILAMVSSTYSAFLYMNF